MPTDQVWTHPATASFQLLTPQFTDLDHGHNPSDGNTPGDGGSRANTRPGPYPPTWYGAADAHRPGEQTHSAAPAAGVAADPDPWRLAAMPVLRSAIANRLHLMSCQHARQAWERRRKDPLSPYVVAWCYADHATAADRAAGRDGWVARVAARLWFEADTPDGLAALLYKLTSVTAFVVRENQDLRTLTSWTEDISGTAWLLGVGVSSLDTPAGDWAQVRRRVDSEPKIPGRCYAHLVDGTRLRVDRYAGDRFGTVDIASTRHLSVGPGDHLSRWRPVEPGELTGELISSRTAMAGDVYVWQWLAQLCVASTPVQGRNHAHGN